MLLKDIPAILERQHLPVLPEVVKRLQDMEAQEAEIRSEHYQSDKDGPLLGKARAEAVRDIEAQVERVVKTDETLARFNQDKARIEADARGESAMTLKERIENFTYRTAAEQVIETERQQAKANRQQLVAAELPGRLEEVRDLTEVSDLNTAYADALVTSDVRTVHVVGKAVLRKLQREAAQAPETSHRRIALTQARRALQTRHEGWLVLHPSTSAQLRQVDANIEGRKRKLQDSLRFTKNYAGLSGISGTLD